MLSKSDIKYIQSLSHKKFREQEQLFPLEGVKMVDELLQEANHAVKKIYAIKDWVSLHKKSIPANVTIQVIEDFELQKLSSQKTPQQVIALVELPQNDIKKQLFDGVTIVLDHIQDPGNLGTIIRTCDWFGIKNIICSPDTVDAFNAKVVQSAMGSILRVNIFYTELNDFFRKHADIPVYSAVLNGISIHKASIASKCFVVIGNESVGISDEILALTSQSITIPKHGKAESLNAAIATSIILSVVKK
jgi:TrmH family RNA methyltransferase